MGHSQSTMDVAFVVCGHRCISSVSSHDGLFLIISHSGDIGQDGGGQTALSRSTLCLRRCLGQGHFTMNNDRFFLAAAAASHHCMVCHYLVAHSAEFRVPSESRDFRPGTQKATNAAFSDFLVATLTRSIPNHQHNNEASSITIGLCLERYGQKCQAEQSPKAKGAWPASTAGRKAKATEEEHHHGWYDCFVELPSHTNSRATLTCTCALHCCE